MENFLKALNRVDWLLAAACLGYGAFARDWRFIAAGLVSLAVAWFNPSRRVKAWLERKMLASPKRRKEQADRASAVRIAQEEAQYVAGTTLERPAPDYRQRPQPYASVRIGPSKHNRLRPGATNLANPVRATWF